MKANLCWNLSSLMSRRHMRWSQINHAGPITFGVQMGDSFTQCHGPFTLCCIWHNVLIHSDTLMPADEASSSSMVACWGSQAKHDGINCQATEIKENLGKVEKLSEIFYGSAATLREVCGSKGFNKSAWFLSLRCTDPNSTLDLNE